MASLIFTGTGIAKTHMPFTAFGNTTLNSDVFDSHGYPVEFAMAVGYNNAKSKMILQGSDDQENWTELNATNLLQLNTASTRHAVSISPTSENGSHPNTFGINGYRYLIWNSEANATESTSNYADYGYQSYSDHHDDITAYCRGQATQILSESDQANSTAYSHRYYRFVFTGANAKAWGAGSIYISPIAEALRNVRTSTSGRTIFNDGLYSVTVPHIKVAICSTAEGTANKAASMDGDFPTTATVMNYFNDIFIYVKFKNAIKTTSSTNARLRVKGLVDSQDEAVYRYLLRPDGTRITNNDESYPEAGLYLLKYVQDSQSTTRYWQILKKVDI